MLEITEDGIIGTPPDRMAAIKKKPIIGKLALRMTRWLRAINVERHLDTGDLHIDIGCGDGYFLFRSPYKRRIGYDILMGDSDEITNNLDFPDNSVDLVSMLAVIEHLPDPLVTLKEIHRVLKPGHKLVLTTPKEAAERVINLYVSHVEDVHEIYFDQKSMQEMVDGLFEVTGYHTFIFGLNQAFCLTKLEN